MKIVPNSKYKLTNILYLFVLTHICLTLIACRPKEVTKARIYLKNNDRELALKQLEIATEAYPENAEAHFLLGQVYGYYARYEDMIKEYDLSLTISDKFEPEITAERERHWIDKFYAGIISIGKQEFENAEDFLTIAILIDSTKHEAYKKLAVTFAQSNQLEKALSIYNELLAKYPDNSDLLISIGNLYYTQEKHEETIPILKRVLEIEPNNPDALAKLAKSYDSIGKSDEAERTFQNALSLNTSDTDLIFLFGIHHYKRNSFEQAIQLFNLVLELNPNDFDAVSNIGSAYLSMGEKVKNKLKTASKSSYTFPGMQKTKNQAIQYFGQAIPYLKKALELQPNHPNLWRNLGIAYINSGKKEEGEEAFIKSQELQIQLSK